MGDGVKFVIDFPKVFVRRDPVVAHSAEVEGAGVRGEGFQSVVAEVFVVIRQGQLADGFIDRVAVADDGMVGFGKGPPAAVFFEEGHDVFVVEFDGLQVEEQWRFTVQP